MVSQETTVAFIIKFEINLDFRRDRSSPLKRNVQIFLVVVGVVILFSSAQSAADHILFLKVNKLCQQHRWSWLSQIFLRCIRADLDLIMNATNMSLDL